jgi:hypothetical protein
LDIDLWLRRAKGSAVQRQKDINRNRLGDELGETNKLYGSILIDDEANRAPLKIFFQRGNCSLVVRTIYILLYIIYLSKEFIPINNFYKLNDTPLMG